MVTKTQARSRIIAHARLTAGEAIDQTFLNNILGPETDYTLLNPLARRSIMNPMEEEVVISDKFDEQMDAAVIQITTSLNALLVKRKVTKRVTLCYSLREIRTGMRLICTAYGETMKLS